MSQSEFESAGDMVSVPREIVANYLNSTLIPRHRRICEAALAAHPPTAATPVGIVGERGDVSWRSDQILPVGTKLYAAATQPEQVRELGRFGHHPDDGTDFEIEVESLQSRLWNAEHGIAKMGTEPESVATVLEAIQQAMTFRVGGIESCVRAKSLLRDLEKRAALREPRA